jgi:hypothetical protein
VKKVPPHGSMGEPQTGRARSTSWRPRFWLRSSRSSSSQVSGSGPNFVTTSGPADLSDRSGLRHCPPVSIAGAAATLRAAGDFRIAEPRSADLVTFHLAASRMAEAIPELAVLNLSDPSTGRQLLNTARPLGTDLPATIPEDVLRRLSETRHQLSTPAMQARAGFTTSTRCSCTCRRARTRASLRARGGHEGGGRPGCADGFPGDRVC